MCVEIKLRAGPYRQRFVDVNDVSRALTELAVRVLERFDASHANRQDVFCKTRPRQIAKIDATRICHLQVERDYMRRHDGNGVVVHKAAVQTHVSVNKRAVGFCSCLLIGGRIIIDGNIVRVNVGPTKTSAANQVVN